MPEERILPISERETYKALPTYSLHLDFLRGVASLVVFVGHLHFICSGHNETAARGQAHGFVVHPANATGLAHAAVVVFFVLSGYLVGGSVLRDLKQDRFSWSRYALRRLSRLWTVLVPTLVLCTVFDAVSLHVFPSTRVVMLGEFSRGLQGWPQPIQFLRYLGFLQSIDNLKIPFFGTDWALWSLSNEFWFYVLFPVLAVGLFGARYPKAVRTVLVGLAICLLDVLGKGISGSFPVWLCGVLAYVTPAKIPARYQPISRIALSIQFCCVVLLMRSVEMGHMTGDLIVALSFTLLLYGLLHQVGPASTTLYSRLAHIMSFPSYSLYAIHIPMCVLLAALCEARFPQVFRHTELTCAIIFPLVLIYAGCFYLLFERNTDNIRNSIEAYLLKTRLRYHLRAHESRREPQLQAANAPAENKVGAQN
jgi:peptidoglycan/LPS O-acetylase OafA/YrhL